MADICSQLTSSSITDAHELRLLLKTHNVTDEGMIDYYDRNLVIISCMDIYVDEEQKQTIKQEAEELLDNFEEDV